MTRHKKHFAIIYSACIAFVGLENAFGQDAKEIDEIAYEIHEWGVFTAPRGATWLQQDMVREWSTFPDFFHGVLPGRTINYRGPVTKPVIFLHSELKFDLLLNIGFETGRPLIWWPPAEFPATGRSWVRKGEEAEPSFADSHLEFFLEVNSKKGKLRKVPKGHWVNDLRRVKSAKISVEGSYKRIIPNNRVAESFVYYDGVMKRPTAPVVHRTAGGIILQTTADHEMIDVMIIERNSDGCRTSGWIANIESGSGERDVKLTRIDDRMLDELKGEFKEKIVDAGLHTDEANSLIAIWNADLFEKNGINLFYRVPQATYDSWLPIKTSIKPSKVVRVGLVVHQRLEPELDARIKKLVEKMGSEDYEARSSAQRELTDIGGAAFSILEKFASGDDPEIASRCRHILKSNITTFDDLLKNVKGKDNRKE